jgi:hypothetical protein
MADRLRTHMPFSWSTICNVVVAFMPYSSNVALARYFANSPELSIDTISRYLLLNGMGKDYMVEWKMMPEVHDISGKLVYCRCDDLNDGVNVNDGPWDYHCMVAADNPRIPECLRGPAKLVKTDEGWTFYFFPPTWGGVSPPGITRPAIQQRGCVTRMMIENRNTQNEIDADVLEYSQPMNGHLKVPINCNRTASSVFVINIEGFWFWDGRDVFPPHFI